MIVKIILKILILTFLIFIPKSFSKTIGSGEIKLTDNMIEYFHEYLKGKAGNKPAAFLITTDGSFAIYWYCPGGSRCHPGDEVHYIKQCEARAGGNKECKVFARGRSIKWKNNINPGKGKISKISSRQSFNEIKSKLKELGFVGNTNKEVTEIKKNNKDTTKKYELKGERSIALSWDGYNSLIAGTVNFDEADYKGNINLYLPNNDGICEGSYSLQEGGKGTWQIACTNDMGAAGTLKWKKKGSVTGVGRDYNEKKVRFTVSKQS